MLDLSILRHERDRVLQGLLIRNAPEAVIELVDKVIETDDLRRASQTERDQVLAEQNALSRVIGDLYRQGKREEAERKKSEVVGLKARSQDLEETLRGAEAELEQLLLQLPNVPHPSVPAGDSDADNEVYRAWEGELPTLPEGALPHWELAEKYGLFDLKLGVKLTGSGFPVFRGAGAVLQRALIRFFLDEAAEAGYVEYLPPLLVNADTARATGQLPDKEGQMYHVTGDNFYLIPTAEVPLTNIYRDTIVEVAELPLKLCGHTPCFRREAGSYGAHVRGLNRVHQFDKVEIVRVEHPQRSYEALYEMIDYVSGLLHKLELPFRVVRLCGGDLGFTSALTYDFEVYSPAQERWLEVSSVSNFETFQSNRLKLRIRTDDGNILAHTLNGSALALPRIMAALLEKNQTADGIVIPDILKPYTGFSRITAGN